MNVGMCLTTMKRRGERVAREINQQLRHAQHLADATLGRGLPSVAVGDRVRIRNEELISAQQAGVVFVVDRVVGRGADAFVSLLAPDGTISEWHRLTELEPATAPYVPPIGEPVGPAIGKIRKTRNASAARPVGKPNPAASYEASRDPGSALLALAASEQKSDATLSLREAIHRVSLRCPEAATAYHEEMNGGRRDRMTPPVLSLSEQAARAEQAAAADAAERRLLALAEQIRKQEGCRYDDAVCRASQRDPAAAAAYLRGHRGA
jgi:hypothetical protein